MEIKLPREKDKKEALMTLMDRCAKAELCISDAERLMYRWRVPKEDWAEVEEHLLREKFIDEERYAAAFVRDKLNFSNWGERKILSALYDKRIPKVFITSAMSQIEKGSLNNKLESDLIRKMRSIKEDNPYKLRDKLIRFGISRGFDFETVKDMIEKIITLQSPHEWDQE